MLNSAQRRHLLGFADSLNHQYNSLVQNQHQFYLRIIFSLLTTSEPSQYRLLLSLVTFDTREGLEEEGRRATIQLLTPAPRPCISPSSVNSPPPMEHGLDLRTRCFLAATVSLLSSFTRDSDEPPLADTTLFVLNSHVFTLSAGQNFMNFGFREFWFVFFRISPAAAELLRVRGCYIRKQSGSFSTPQILVSSCTLCCSAPTHATCSCPGPIPAACCPRPDSTQRSWERILKIYITLLHTKQKASRSKCPWERFLSFTFNITTKYNFLESHLSNL